MLTSASETHTAPSVTPDFRVATSHREEVARGQRFAFGRNWQRFLALLDEERIRRAEMSLRTMLRRDGLAGLRFLDIGCGSGLFSLAARRLGATVHSFDFDPGSVWCARQLRERFFAGDGHWTIEAGSVLDPTYMRSLGTFDIVYSWGVLHHTGRMWDGVDAASRAVAPGGSLFIALYNDLGTRSRRWRAVKRLYNRTPALLRPLLTAAAIAPQEIKNLTRTLAEGSPSAYLRSWTGYDDRGMNHWRDAVDWVGGYPYEVATPDAVFDFCRGRGLALATLKCGGVGLGCNEFVFTREPARH